MLKGILVMSCIRPCVQLFMGLALCIADKSLGRNGQQIGMLMYPDDLCSAVIDNYGYYCLCPTIWVFLFFFIYFLRLGLGQRRSVVIIGRWLLPSLVDTGDICCHYWQHILVLKPILLTNEILRVAFAYLVSWRQSLRVDSPKASQRSIIT